MYEIIEQVVGQDEDGVDIIEEMIQYTDANEKKYFIPTDPKNPDYQAYLLSLEEE